MGQGSGTPRNAAPAGIPAPDAGPTRIPLYEMSDVIAALGRQPSDDDDILVHPSHDAGRTRRDVLEGLVRAGDAGRWRDVVHPARGVVDRVRELGDRAPHMRSVTNLVACRLLASTTIGLPVALPPLLLLGPPGTGKTWLTTRVAEALGVPFRLHAMNMVTLGDGLSGSHAVWKGASSGLVARTLLEGKCANPVICVDELDKPPGREAGLDVYRPLFAALERENARRWLDEYLGVAMDASRVLWVASANDPRPIPSPILDRMTVVEVGAMSRDDRMTVLRSIYGELNATYRRWFDPEPAVDVLHRLATAPPRRAKTELEEAMVRAAAGGRRSVVPRDLVGGGTPPAPVRPKGDLH